MSALRAFPQIIHLIPASIAALVEKAMIPRGQIDQAPQEPENHRKAKARHDVTAEVEPLNLRVLKAPFRSFGNALD